MIDRLSSSSLSFGFNQLVVEAVMIGLTAPSAGVPYASPTKLTQHLETRQPMTTLTCVASETTGGQVDGRTR